MQNTNITGHVLRCWKHQMPVISVYHKEHANYGAHLYNPVVCIYIYIYLSCWCVVSTWVTKESVQSVCFLPTPITYLGPWNRFCDTLCDPVCMCLVSSCPSQENTNKWFWKTVLSVQWHDWNFYWYDEANKGGWGEAKVDVYSYRTVPAGTVGSSPVGLTYNTLPSIPSKFPGSNSTSKLQQHSQPCLTYLETWA
jgi:hypothetical protein